MLKHRLAAVVAATGMALGVLAGPAQATSPLVDLTGNGDGRGWWSVRADGSVEEGGPAAQLEPVDLGAATVVDTEVTVDGRGLYVLGSDGAIHVMFPDPNGWHPQPNEQRPQPDDWAPQPNSWHPDPNEWVPKDLEVAADGRSAWVLFIPRGGDGGGKLFHLADGQATEMIDFPRLREIPQVHSWFPVDMAVTPDGRGVWVISDDGRIATTGSATPLHPDVDDLMPMDVEATPSGRGLWVLGESGQIAVAGDAVDHGNIVAIPDVDQWMPVGFEANPSGGGYRILDNTGRITTFGDAAGRCDGVNVKLPSC